MLFGFAIYIISIKVAALIYIYILDEFAGKFKKFKSLAGQPRNSKVKIWTQKLWWGFTIANEVRNLRAYIIAYVGSLNIRLLIEELSSIYIIGERFKRTQTSLIKVCESTKVTSKIMQSIQLTLEKIAIVIISDQVARIYLLVKMQESFTLALQYTYYTKVAAREYELFNPLDSLEVILKSNFNNLRLGMSLTINTKCNICFKDARTRLLLPYRDNTLNCISVHFYKVARKERLCFKNIRLRGYKSLNTIAKENHPKAYIKNAINS
ncbi:hypothetical protein V2W45_1471180 [Cenococcum geophilum]